MAQKKGRKWVPLASGRVCHFRSRVPRCPPNCLLFAKQPCLPSWPNEFIRRAQCVFTGRRQSARANPTAQNGAIAAQEFAVPCAHLDGSNRAVSHASEISKNSAAGTRLVSHRPQVFAWREARCLSPSGTAAFENVARRISKQCASAAGQCILQMPPGGELVCEQTRPPRENAAPRITKQCVARGVAPTKCLL
jgi:hypothetical protein